MSGEEVGIGSYLLILPPSHALVVCYALVCSAKALEVNAVRLAMTRILEASTDMLALYRVDLKDRHAYSEGLYCGRSQR